MILIKFEAGLVIVQSLVPTISFESKRADIITISLQSSQAGNIAMQGIVDHLKSFGIDQVQLWILKLQRWYHVLSFVCCKLDTVFFGFVYLLKEFVVKPSTSIQGFS